MEDRGGAPQRRRAMQASSQRPSRVPPRRTPGSSGKARTINSFPAPTPNTWDSVVIPKRSGLNTLGRRGRFEAGRTSCCSTFPQSKSLHQRKAHSIVETGGKVALYACTPTHPYQCSANSCSMPLQTIPRVEHGQRVDLHRVRR